MDIQKFVRQNIIAILSVAVLVLIVASAIQHVEIWHLKKHVLGGMGKADIMRRSNSIDKKNGPSLSQNTDQQAVVDPETASWKTYHSDTYGYEVKYPQNWEFAEHFEDKSGATFIPIGNQKKAGTTNGITMQATGKPLLQCNVPFTEYVKTAAITEIQNYEKLNSITSIRTFNATGYKTTWVVKDFSGKTSISEPITYFELPSQLCEDGKDMVNIFLDQNEYSQVYDKMIATFKIVK